GNRCETPRGARRALEPMLSGGVPTEYPGVGHDSLVRAYRDEERRCVSAGRDEMELQARWYECEGCLHRGGGTEVEVDAIVNAANENLWPGGGVCGAIYRRAGRALAEECNLIIAVKSSIPEGQAVITTGGDLPARHVIHAVGPFYEDDPEKAPELL